MVTKSWHIDQIKPIASENGGRETLSSLDLSWLMDPLGCHVVPCHTTPYWQSVQKTHTWDHNEFLTEKKLCAGDREVCVFWWKVRMRKDTIGIIQPVSPAPAFERGWAPLEGLWMKKGGTLEAHSYTENLLWQTPCPVFIDEWLLQAHRCAENYKSWRKQRDIGTSPDTGMSWGQMLISARKATYKRGIWENILKKRKNEIQEMDTKMFQGKKRELGKRREEKVREIFVTTEGRQEE